MSKKSKIDPHLYIQQLEEQCRRLQLINAEVTQQNESLLYLYKELNHRLKNSLLTLAAHVQSLIRKINKGTDPGSMPVLQEINNRLDSIILLTNQLDSPNAQNQIDLQEYFTQLATHLKVNANYPDANFKAKIQLSKAPSLSLSVASRLGMVITELIQNAVKYADVPDKSIQFEAVYEEAQLIFVIEDNGPGISAETTEHTGLKTVRAIVEMQLSGTLELDTSQSGTRWIVRTPVLSNH